MVNLKERTRHHRAAITIFVIVIVVLVFAGIIAGYAYAFSGKFYSGVHVGSVNLGNLTEEEGRTVVNTLVDSIISDGMRVQVEHKTDTIPLRLLAPDDPDLSHDFVVLQTEEALDRAYAIGREGSILVRGFQILSAMVGTSAIAVPADVNTERIEEELLNAFGEFYNPAVEPQFAITFEENAWQVDVEPGRDGRSFDMEQAVSTISDMLSNLDMRDVQIAVVDQEPHIDDEEAASLTDQVELSLLKAPYAFSYDAGRFDQHTFSLKGSDLAPALVPTNDGRLAIGLNESLDAFFDDIAERINVEAQDARFSISGNRVHEFRPSLEGREVDVDATRDLLIDELNRTEEDPVCDCPDDAPCTCDTFDLSSEPIEIVVHVTEPEVTTGEVNDLGITEILGVGVSDFSGSPSNRIKNIRHGISKLNGTLIAPDEEFSLITALKPFTISDGYLPELVIKGDEIKPEVGGGLCQIGSTTFRAVMNSGMDITQRRNHSLVVNYYNDPSNGNPGTDATLYDPAPDFKFVNDTGHHILLTTEMNVNTGRLAFTFWGTNDGRKGYYSAPVVHNWIPAGVTQTTYTTDLQPGERKCQGAHPGANASFTYTVEQADGTVNQTTYDSYYRPLPQICLVGVEEGQLDEEGNLIEDTSEEAAEKIDIEELSEDEIVETVE